MNDPRYRLLSVAVLSVAAFANVAGAVGAMLWWLACSDRRMPRGRAALYLGLTVLLAAGATAASGGDGIGYLVRISAVLLIAAHGYASNRDGDLFDLGAWVGEKIGLPGAGFDLGLTAELALGSLRSAGDDLALIRVAVSQKRLPLLRRWLATGTALLHTQFRRGRAQADLLVLRGYVGGGCHAPHFDPARADRAAAALAISVLLLAFLAPRGFFILSL